MQKAWEPLVIQAELKGLMAQFCVPEEILFYGDGGWTVEAVGNLLKNCAEHLSFGGRLWITASQNPLYTELLVADDGPGIPPEDLPHVFERFYRGAGGNISGNNGKQIPGNLARKETEMYMGRKSMPASGWRWPGRSSGNRAEYLQ